MPSPSSALSCGDSVPQFPQPTTSLCYNTQPWPSTDTHMSAWQVWQVCLARAALGITILIFTMKAESTLWEGAQPNSQLLG